MDFLDSLKQIKQQMQQNGKDNGLKAPNKPANEQADAKDKFQAMQEEFSAYIKDSGIKKI